MSEHHLRTELKAIIERRELGLITANEMLSDIEVLLAEYKYFNPERS